MTRLRRLLSIVNLLCHRRHVTIDAIVKICGVSRRTAFRYINAISEANIPVFYDRRVGAYSLSGRTSLPGVDITPSEAVVVVVALQALATRVNESYRVDVEEVITKVVSHQPYRLEDVLGAFAAEGCEYPPLQDYSDYLSAILIHAAVSRGRKLRLVAKGSGTGWASSVVINEPALRFSDTWGVIDKSVADEPRPVFRVVDIRRVDVL